MKNENSAENMTEQAKKKEKAAPVKKKATQTRKPMPPKLELLFTIVNRDKADVFTALLESFDINLQLVVAAEGTATTEMLRYLGYSDNKKAVIISVIRKDRVEAAMNFLNEKFKTIKNGKGIAYTVPMTGTIGVAIYQFLINSNK